MRISRIYCDNRLESGHSVELNDKTSHYLSKVLRHKVGDAVILFNGEGGCFDGTIVTIAKKSVHVHVEDFNAADNMPDIELHIAVGVCKGDKMDWLVQKATELGASSIQPLSTEFSDVKLSAERWQKKCTHWQQIAISACEQSNRNLVTNILPQKTWDQWLKSPVDGERWLFHPEGEHALSDKKPTTKMITLCFGPEGGFSQQEVNQARNLGARIVNLGSRILRAETAPLVALAVCQYL